MLKEGVGRLGPLVQIGDREGVMQHYVGLGGGWRGGREGGRAEWGAALETGTEEGTALWRERDKMIFWEDGKQGGIRGLRKHPVCRGTW